MAGQLTTHVLDTARGRPGAGISVELWRLDGKEPAHLTTAVTNSDGRTDSAILSGDDFAPGTYELRFHIGPYFAEQGAAGGGLFDVVPIRFIVGDPDGHYHIPLLASAWSYSTYRGS
jgi:5-hydroxyisourate hydrolase